MNRTRSFATAAFMVAIVGGCDPSTITQVDVCPDKPGIQLTGPCEEPQPELGTVTAAFDTPNPVIVQGDRLSCLTVTVAGAKNLPVGFVLDTALFLEDGTSVSCGSVAGVGPQLVSGTPPEPATAKLTIGPQSPIVEGHGGPAAGHDIVTHIYHAQPEPQKPPN